MPHTIVRTLIRASMAGALVFALAGMPPARAADQWTLLASDLGGELAYEAEGNLLRLRVRNGGPQAAQLGWKAQITLENGISFERSGAFVLDPGAAEHLSLGPFRDGDAPARVKKVAGNLKAKPLGAAP